MEPEDKEFIDKIKQGDADAETVFYNKFKSRLLPIARQNFPSESEDIIQITLQKAFHALKNGNHRGGSLKYWIYRIFVNVQNDKLRDEILPSRKNVPLESAMNCSETDRASPEMALYKQEVKEALFRAMSHLKEKKREVVYLRVVKGLPLEEISERLDIKIGSIARILSESRDELVRKVNAILLKQKKRRKRF